MKNPNAKKPPALTIINRQRLLALIQKETLQALRDPSTLLIAFVLPIILLFIFAYAVSLDAKNIALGLINENKSQAAIELEAGLLATPYLKVYPFSHTKEAVPHLISGKIRGYVVIPADFNKRLANNQLVYQGLKKEMTPLVQIITDGSQPNTANYVKNYTSQSLALWQRNQLALEGGEAAMGNLTTIELQPRFWFNAELESKRALIPGSIAIIMTIIGTLLTALVVAKEWERGTMEAILATPASIVEILIGKLFPYFVLGMLATFLSAIVTVFFFKVPLQGSMISLLILSAVFMIPALGQGLLISSITRNQFLASQIALFSGFLPSFILSDFLFEISAMPFPIQLITYVVPAKYFVNSLKTVFLVGDLWPLFLPNILAMLGMGILFFSLAKRVTRKDLE